MGSFQVSQSRLRYVQVRDFCAWACPLPFSPCRSGVQTCAAFFHFTLVSQYLTKLPGILQPLLTCGSLHFQVCPDTYLVSTGSCGISAACHPRPSTPAHTRTSPRSCGACARKPTSHSVIWENGWISPNRGYTTARPVIAGWIWPSSLPGAGHAKSTRKMAWSDFSASDLLLTPSPCSIPSNLATDLSIRILRCKNYFAPDWPVKPRPQQKTRKVIGW